MSFALYTPLTIVTWFLYGWSFWLYWRAFFHKKDPNNGQNNSPNEISQRASIFHKLALLVHGGLLLFLGLHYNRCPLGTRGEALLFCSWLFSLAYWLSELFSKEKHLGFFTVSLLLIGVTASLLLLALSPVVPMDIDGILAFHIVVSLSAYACFSIGSTLSLMYVLLFKKLKNKEFDVYFQRLPSLVVLERFSAVWVFIGVMFMTTASLIGTYWSQMHSPNATMSLREIGIYSVLILFAFSLLSYKCFQFKGVRFAIANLIGFGLLVLTQILQVHGFHH